MADRVLPGPVSANTCINEAVCVHTSKIFDSCRDKDCVEDLRVYPTNCSQAYLDCAISIRPRSVKLLYVDVDVEEMTFNRGYYAVDATFFYKVCGETYPGANMVTGLAVFNKRVILFGSEGSAKVFSSKNCANHKIICSDQPCAVVEAVDPIALSMKLVEPGPCPKGEAQLYDVPETIMELLGEDLMFTPAGKRWYVTLGQFSIIRLERDTQLVIPSYNYCFPEKECVGGSEDDPCALFERIRFPVEEFFPPDSVSCPEEYKELL